MPSMALVVKARERLASLSEAVASEVSLAAPGRVSAEPTSTTLEPPSAGPSARGPASYSISQVSSPRQRNFRLRARA